MSDPQPDIAASPPFDSLVVGIGASAGGLKALLEFFSKVAPRSGMAYVVVVHLSPEHASNLPQLIQGAAPVPVAVAAGRMKIEQDHVYVVSPKSDLVMQDGYLDAVPRQRREQGATFAIDRTKTRRIFILIRPLGPSNAAAAPHFPAAV